MDALRAPFHTDAEPPLSIVKNIDGIQNQIRDDLEDLTPKDCGYGTLKL